MIPEDIYVFLSPWWMAEEAGFQCQYRLVITTATEQKEFTSREQRKTGKTSSDFLQILTFVPPLEGAAHGKEASPLFILFIKEMPSHAAA